MKVVELRNLLKSLPPQLQVCTFNSRTGKLDKVTICCARKFKEKDFTGGNAELENNEYYFELIIE